MRNNNFKVAVRGLFRRAVNSDTMSFAQKGEAADKFVSELCSFPFQPEDRVKLADLLGTSEFAVLESAMNLAVEFPHGPERAQHLAEKESRGRKKALRKLLSQVQAALADLNLKDHSEILEHIPPLPRRPPGRLGITPEFTNPAAERENVVLQWSEFQGIVPLLNQILEPVEAITPGSMKIETRGRPPEIGRQYVAEAIAGQLKSGGYRATIARSGRFVKALAVCLQYLGSNSKQAQEIAEHVARNHLAARTPNTQK